MTESKSVLSSIALYITACVMLSIVCATVFFMVVTEKELMSKNLERAIEKGIDPMAVRCSYADANDRVCLAYSIRTRGIDAPGAPTTNLTRK